VVGAPADY